MKKTKQDLIKAAVKNEADLFKLFGEYARYVFGSYAIDFNGKLFIADTPSDLFKKVKDEYNLLIK